jgi:iron complex outermembrane receptor protein
MHFSERLNLSAGIVWVPKREFVEFRDDESGDIISGNKLRRAPEWTSNVALNYEFPVREIGSFSSRIEYNYRSGYFFTKENTEPFSQDHFGLWNVLLNFESITDRWYAFASARNLTNEDYFNQVFIQSSPGYPDTYEIGFGYRF